MKLNYKVDTNNISNKKEDNFNSKTKTKLSMQSLVHSALASKQPSNPQGQYPQPNTNNGWGKSN